MHGVSYVDERLMTCPGRDAVAEPQGLRSKRSVSGMYDDDTDRPYYYVTDRMILSQINR
jgi:hypothetical protein